MAFGHAGKQLSMMKLPTRPFEAKVNRLSATSKPIAFNWCDNMSAYFTCNLPKAWAIGGAGIHDLKS
jgi:hypothetical protein